MLPGYVYIKTICGTNTERTKQNPYPHTRVWSLAPSLVYMGYSVVPHSIPGRPNQPLPIVIPRTASKSAGSTQQPSQAIASKHWSLRTYRSCLGYRVRVRVEWYELIYIKQTGSTHCWLTPQKMGARNFPWGHFRPTCRPPGTTRQQ